MERRTKARIAVVVSVLSLISMPILFLIAFSTALFLPLTFGILILCLLFLWFVAMIAAISFSKEGWTVRGSASEWVLAAMFDPILTGIMYLLSRDEEKRDTGRDLVDLVEYKRKRLR